MTDGSCAYLGTDSAVQSSNHYGLSLRYAVSGVVAKISNRILDLRGWLLSPDGLPGASEAGRGSASWAELV